jgi:2-polyprenyl-6-methoxyphenol hydroxylase-like FAD-dependent oxidoreductase
LHVVRVIVVGAGIGGVTTALALQRDEHEVVVLERAAEPSHLQAGSGMQITPNALNALEWAKPGLVEEVTDSGVVLEHMDFRTDRGHLLVEWPVGDWAREANVGCTVAIRRGDLHGIISRAVREGTLRFGSACTEFEQDDDEVRVRLADGSVETGDILVGADGVQSSVRRALLDDGQPDPAGYASIVGFAKWDGDFPGPGRMSQFMGKGLRIVAFHVDPTTVCWVGYIGDRAAVNRDASPKDEALGAFGGWPDPLRPLIEAAPGDGVRRLEGFARAPVERWGDGRATLLGDAAHPMVVFGQGANQAIEDAIVLSRSLSHDDDPTAALRGYEAKRIARTAPLTRLARRTVSMFHWRNPLLSVLRDRVIIPVYFKSVVPGKQRELYEYRASGE